MRLKTDWRNILQKSKAIKMATVSAVASGVQIVLPYLDAFISPVPLAILAALCAIAAIGARLIHNPEIDDGC